MDRIDQLIAAVGQAGTEAQAAAALHELLHATQVREAPSSRPWDTRLADLDRRLTCPPLFGLPLCMSLPLSL